MLIVFFNFLNNLCNGPCTDLACKTCLSFQEKQLRKRSRLNVFSLQKNQSERGVAVYSGGHTVKVCHCKCQSCQCGNKKKQSEKIIKTA